ncbi:hypothetical protein ES708_23498 [subsurface metagenome]
MKKSQIKTTSQRITLTDAGKLCLKNIRKAGYFRSDSSTIEECLLFIQALRDGNAELVLAVRGERFGISIGGKEYP